MRPRLAAGPILAALASRFLDEEAAFVVETTDPERAAELGERTRYRFALETD